MMIIFFLYFMPFLFFPLDINYFNILTLPYGTLNVFIYYLGWINSFVLITISIFTIIKYENINNNYIFALLINLILNWLNNFMLYELNNILLFLISILIGLLSTLYLFIQTNKINKKLSYTIIFYLFWLIYNIILFTIIGF
ncbi:MAG: tryptophan-rich sensory protein [Bacilli bacterium]|nr:tryptophan-rich sensory protein [Bacilli bacterium]